MIATDQWNAGQFMGRRWPIGCVALEITQRCNLDCSACYLSEHSEAVKDLPMEEISRRIDMILAHYGPNTDIQVTGGDPTLRRRDELVAIVGQIRRKGMRPSLFTNGIRAKRDLLRELAAAGLVDVAFHVDLTQERKGYDSEIALNVVRQEYIERARGLCLPIIFNTTIFEDNFDEVPELVNFFVRNSDVVRVASFQLLAKTGRGRRDRRGDAITIASVGRQIEKGAGSRLSFDAVQIGHSCCNRYAMALVVNNRVHDLLDDVSLARDFLRATAHVQFDRQNRAGIMKAVARELRKHPALAARAMGWVGRKLWRARSDLVAARGQVNKLSFFIHNFMDACQLERERIDACVFTAVTRDGPISMCLHNAKRDAFILEPIRLDGADGGGFWNPVSGEVMKTGSVGITELLGSKGKRVPGWRARAAAVNAVGEK